MATIRFGTDGWRAVYADDFTFHNCRVLGQAIAAYITAQNLGRKGLVIAYDHRFMAEHFAQQCARVIVGNGIKTYLMRKATPTPLAALAVQELEAGGAIMFTASNHPYEYGGMKFIPAYAGPALPEITDYLEQEAAAIMTAGRIYGLDLHEAERLDLFKEIELDRPYLDALKRFVRPEAFQDANLKVVIDPMFGSGVGYLEKLLQELGCEVKTIHNYRDPLFGGTPPAPLENNLVALRSSVLNHQAELGLALNGDGERFGIIDNEGNYINPNHLLAMILDHLVKNRSFRGPVARTRACGHLLDRVARRHALPVIETDLGFKYLGQALREQSCIMAAEENGGLGLIGHVSCKDGTLAGLLICEMMAVAGISFAQYYRQFLNEYGVLYNLHLDIPIEATRLGDVEKTLAALKFKTLAGNRVISCDFDHYLMISMEHGSWVLVRRSGTGDFLRVYIEGETMEQVELIKDEFLNELGLFAGPF